MTFQNQSDDWKSNQSRPSSINLLDMTDVLLIQPNITNQIKQHSLDLIETDCPTKIKDTNKEIENLLDKKEVKTKLSYNSLQMFDPLQPRVENTSEEKQSTKVIPTRLPTPRRPIHSTDHFKDDQLQVPSSTTSVSATTSSNSNIIQLNPTPPSSPGRRIRQTSIARLVKIPNRESLGKANRELAEFDPLISPVREKKTSSIQITDNTVIYKSQKDNTAKKGNQVCIKGIKIEKFIIFFFSPFLFSFII
jgi:hypothetical protein